MPSGEDSSAKGKEACVRGVAEFIAGEGKGDKAGGKGDFIIGTLCGCDCDCGGGEGMAMRTDTLTFWGPGGNTTPSTLGLELMLIFDALLRSRGVDANMGGGGLIKLWILRISGTLSVDGLLVLIAFAVDVGRGDESAAAEGTTGCGEVGDAIVAENGRMESQSHSISV